MPSHDSTEGRPQDKTRLCPTCRMEISVLATKCRFCGEEVGRPREEQRTLTIEDLGGETIEHYAPSNSVMEALEAFRSEESFRKSKAAAEAKKKSSIFGRHRIPEEEDTSEIPETKLPPLDAYSRSLAASVAPPSAKSYSPYRQKPQGHGLPDWYRSAVILTFALIVIAIIAFAGMKAAPKIRAMISTQNENQFMPPNPAISMLESGEDLVEVLDVAVKHQRKYDNPESRATLEDVKTKLKKHIEELLAQNPFDQNNLSKAWEKASKAYNYCPSEDLLELKNKVSSEVRLYGAMLLNTDVDSKPPVAEFSLVGPDTKEIHITVKEGESFCENRFQLTLVKRDEVCLIDALYNRKLRCNKATGITRF